ncbi:PLP-dependent aminotransferase family protein [Teredinibacter turnerae]|uniref:aminotransferase-like domain-containing protein n=1 Tax=Teredinibacter turnerae TaxID=2426 RepID=UPI0003FF851A|nr:PLP-dependent aminotransferase family protein [Teredinibacter turnerae]
MKTACLVESLPTSYIREILQAATAADCLSLAGGLPDPKYFPLDATAEALRAVADSPAVHGHLFQYASTRGYQPLIDHLQTQLPVGAGHELLMTNGSQQGIDLAVRTYLNQGDEVALEVPAYLGALQVFALAGIRVRPIPQLPFGPDLEALRKVFETGRCKMFYTVPDFHNPTGCCWSLDVRTEVARLCRKHGVLLLEDAPYRDIRFHGESLPLVSDFCSDVAIVLNSFSKTAMPGLRLGAIVADKKLLAPMLRVKQAVDLHTNTLGQFLLAEFLVKGNYAAHVANLCRNYGAKYEALHAALELHATEFGYHRAVQGGMFIWFVLHELDATLVAQRCLERGLAVVPGGVFFPAGEKHSTNALRLNFSYLAISQLEEAAARLAAVLRELSACIAVGGRYSGVR